MPSNHDPRARRSAARAARRRRPRSRAAFADRLADTLGPPPPTPADLRDWVRRHLGALVPSRAILTGSAAPLDYLAHAFFEGTGGLRPDGRPPPPAHAPPDCVVWASRGGGKTFLAAVATLLDLLYKPGIQVRILGGSLEQSRRMLAHLHAFLRLDHLAWAVDSPGGLTGRRVRLRNGSAAEVLAASQTSVRGTRVQKLRCDEVDLFDPDVWLAAQLTTRSVACPGPWGALVRGSVEALSTMHQPMGLMWDIVGAAQAGDRRLFRWGVVDTLESCPPARPCESCALRPECAGLAKPGAARPAGEGGHVAIDDAVAMKARVGLEAWQTEMLCLRPRRADTVFPDFDPAVHVFGAKGAEGATGLRPVPEIATETAGAAALRAVPGDSTTLAAAMEDAPAPPPPGSRLVCAIDFGFRGETAILFAHHGADGVLRVVDERVRADLRLDAHIDAILRSPWGVPALVAADPAGRQVNAQSGLSNIAMLRRAGLCVASRPSSILEGVGLVRARLRPAAGGPTLFIHARCARLVEALLRYRFDPARPDSLVPLKEHGLDHPADALRYLVLNLDRPWRAGRRNYAA
jgi:hypothetical protein